MLEEVRKRIQNCCATLRRSRIKGNVGSCRFKSLTGFNLCATTPNNIQQHTTRCTNGRNMYHPTMLGLVGQERCVRLHRALFGKREGKNGVTGLNKKKDFLETSSRLSVIPWGTTRITALRAQANNNKKKQVKVLPYSTLT